jgi:hypothetical protein
MKSDPNDSEFDRRLRKELHGSFVPESLAERLYSNILESAGVDNTPASESRMEAMLESAASEDRTKFSAEDAGNEITLSNPTNNSSRFNGRTGSSRRRRWLFSLAGAAAAAVVGLAIFHVATSPTGLSKRAFAALMEDKLEDLESAERNSNAHTLPPTVLAFLTQNFRLQRMGVSGEYKISPPKDPRHAFEVRGTAWKLVGDAGVLYVAVLENIHLAETLPRSLEVIQNSGPWNLAATSYEGKIFLVAARGDIRRYFSPRPLA